VNISTLNQQFGASNTLRFVEDSNGLIVAEIENPLASAKICLQGAHLLSWRPRSSPIPIVWMSDAIQLLPGKSPHSGAPVCWPWFGAHASNSALPAHGFARNLPWEVINASTESDGVTHVTMRLLESETAHEQWPHAASLELTLKIGESLVLELRTTNAGDSPITISEAFHTYFQVGDITQTRVMGLEGTVYADKVENFARSTQEGEITFAGEVDRVYLSTANTCVIEDPVLKRRIHITKSGSLSTVVWTPGQEKGDQLGDLGVDGWRRMVCVESANTMENSIEITGGQSHTLAVGYRASPL